MNNRYIGFVNYYIHQVNLVRHLLGEPYSVTYADPSGVLLVGKSESGVACTIEMTPYRTTLHWQESAFVCFQNGYVKIDLPAQELTRLQTQGGEVWPHGAVYRVRTVHGDDFLVDARESRFTLINQLGSFSPSLADCRSVRPVDDPEGDWRIELATGTVLIGELDGSQLTLAMTLGPETVTVPLASFDSMEQQTWSTAQQITEGSRRLGVSPGGGAGRKSKAAPAWSSWENREDGSAVEALDEQAYSAAAAMPVADDSETSDGWFQRDNLQRAKKSAN